jgi:AraC-like DNA-binding protein
MDLRVEKTQQMMRENLHRDMSLGTIARSVNLSVWRFCHVFRAEVGMSPIQYLRFLRMERAKHLLESSFLSIKEIGHLVGLKDESHFVRDFKKAYGLSPKCYRTLFNSEHSNESLSNEQSNESADDDDLPSDTSEDDSRSEPKAVAPTANPNMIASLNMVLFSCFL